MKILCFGSTLIKKDSLAHDVADALSGKLPGFGFVKCNSYDDLVEHENEEFIILDVAEGISKPKWLMRSELMNYKRYSSHDLDLSFYLKLLKPKCRIFALPAGMKKAGAIRIVKRALKTYALGGALKAAPRTKGARKSAKQGARSTGKGTKQGRAEKARRKPKRGEKC